MQQKNQLIDFWKNNFNFTNIELNAFRTIKREDFISEELKQNSYDDIPLPLLRGKTISQPTTVMIMTSILELKTNDNVFEVGTGSGYQAALIAKIIGPRGKIITTEVIPELVVLARTNIKKANLDNVEIFEEDGSKGNHDQAPFDKIIITAACKNFPDILVDQLKPNGIIVGPVGTRDEQTMVKGIKNQNGGLDLEFLGPFLFTPMYGKFGFET